MSNVTTEIRIPFSERRRTNLVETYHSFSNKAEWAKTRILVIAEMLEEQGEDWYANQLKEIANIIPPVG